MVKPSKKLSRIRLPAPMGPMTCPSEAIPVTGWAEKYFSRSKKNWKDSTTHAIICLTGIPDLFAISKHSGSISISATVRKLPAEKANIIESLFLNFKMMNPPRSVDKNVIKATMIAVGFISDTSLIIFSKMLKIIPDRRKPLSLHLIRIM
ncbi:MAG TPA: hypothetical protein VK568_14975 [Thermodesulfobacteriota bacterium]|nr:hypothetical protein [Thermodesulfobacteriota bacterium]